MKKPELINSPKVSLRVREAAKYITDFPGSKGEAVAAAIHISFDHFRKAIVPVLKAHGFKNYHNGNGYFPPITRQTPHRTPNVEVSGPTTPPATVPLPTYINEHSQQLAFEG